MASVGGEGIAEKPTVAHLFLMRTIFCGMACIPRQQPSARVEVLRCAGAAESDRATTAVFDSHVASMVSALDEDAVCERKSAEWFFFCGEEQLLTKLGADDRRAWTGEVREFRHQTAANDACGDVVDRDALLFRFASGLLA